MARGYRGSPYSKEILFFRADSAVKVCFRREMASLEAKLALLHEHYTIGWGCVGFGGWAWGEGGGNSV